MKNLTQRGATVARQSHKLKAVGSIPTSAPIYCYTQVFKALCQRGSILDSVGVLGV